MIRIDRQHGIEVFERPFLAAIEHRLDAREVALLRFLLALLPPADSQGPEQALDLSKQAEQRLISSE